MFDYKINVSINGEYYFDVEARGADEATALEIAAQLATRFPSADVTLTKWTKPEGRDVYTNKR